MAHLLSSTKYSNFDSITKESLLASVAEQAGFSSWVLPSHKPLAVLVLYDCM